MDPVNHHLHRPCIIGRFGVGKVIAPVSRSAGTIAPEPYSRYAGDAGSPPAMRPDTVRAYPVEAAT
jgi:hypothetical protein